MLCAGVGLICFRLSYFVPDTYQLLICLSFFRSPRFQFVASNIEDTFFLAIFRENNWSVKLGVVFWLNQLKFSYIKYVPWYFCFGEKFAQILCLIGKKYSLKIISLIRLSWYCFCEMIITKLQIVLHQLNKTNQNSKWQFCYKLRMETDI